MGFFSGPPSIYSLDPREKKEFEAIMESVLTRFPERFHTHWIAAKNASAELEDRRVAELQAAVLELAWQENPGSFLVHYMLCEFYVGKLDRFVDALAVAQKLVERFPKDPRSPYSLASVYYNLSKPRAEELSPIGLMAVKAMPYALGPGTGDDFLASQAIRDACEELALTPMQASELAAQYFRRTLELGVRHAERRNVEECYRNALEAYHNRKLGKSL